MSKFNLVSIQNGEEKVSSCRDDVQVHVSRVRARLPRDVRGREEGRHGPALRRHHVERLVPVLSQLR